MPYKLFTKKIKGKKKYCAKSIMTGKEVCYDSKEAREEGLKIRMRYAGDVR